MRIRRLLVILLILLLSACEGGLRLRNISSSPEYSYPKVSVDRAAIDFPTPLAADRDFAALYARNAKSFYDNLLNQFKSNIALAVSNGNVSEDEQTKIVKAANKRHRKVKKSLNALLSSINRSSSDNFSPRLRFKSVFPSPVRKIAAGSEQLKLASDRLVTGQVDSYDGLAISFTKSLNTQIKPFASSRSQKKLAKKMTKALVKVFKRDIKALIKLTDKLNSKRFKNTNSSNIVAADFVGDFSGTCTNVSNGRVENMTAEVSSKGGNIYTLTFFRPNNLYGAAAIESFDFAFDPVSGAVYQQNLPLFGNVKISIQPSGFIKGKIGSEPASGLDKVNLWGVANASDQSIIIDVRMDFPEFSEGGQAHAIMELTKD